MTACATGCTLRGRHTTTCDTDGCTGCLPTPVDPPATICTNCHARLRHALTACPDLVTHILGNIEPGRGEPTEHHGPRQSPPAPLNVTALSDADDLHARLAAWADLITGTGRPPRERTTRNTAGDITGIRHPNATRVLVIWLLRRTKLIAEQDWAHEMVREVTRTVRILTARWPVEDRPVYLPVPCPACGCDSLVRYAPRWEGAPVTITCRLTECGHTVPEDRYAWLIRLYQGATA
jgi:hypothetical protein